MHASQVAEKKRLVWVNIVPSTMSVFSDPCFNKTKAPTWPNLASRVYVIIHNSMINSTRSRSGRQEPSSKLFIQESVWSPSVLRAFHDGKFLCWLLPSHQRKEYVQQSRQVRDNGLNAADEVLTEHSVLGRRVLEPNSNEPLELTRWTAESRGYKSFSYSSVTFFSWGPTGNQQLNWKSRSSAKRLKCDAVPCGAHLIRLINFCRSLFFVHQMCVRHGLTESISGANTFPRFHRTW